MTTKKMDIQKEAVCLCLKLGRIQTRKKAETSAIQTDAQPELVHVSKVLFECDELKAIISHQDKVSAYIKARSLPSPFKTGVYLIRLSLVTEVMDWLEKQEAEQTRLVEAFMVFYDKLYAERHDPQSAWALKLASLYQPGDYPAPKRVKESFRFETQLWELSTPGALKAMDRALYQKELEKMQNVWEGAKAQIVQVLLGEFKKMTARMADRLAPGDDGKPKQFRAMDSATKAFQQWLDLFDKRDLTNDEELTGLVNQARAMVQGLDPEEIRSNDVLRTEIAEEMGKLTKEVEKCIITKPARRIDLEEENG